MICVRGSGEDFPLQVSNSVDLKLSDSAKLTNTAAIASPHFFQKSTTTATSTNLHLRGDGDLKEEKLTLSLLAHLANLSQFKESEKQQQTNEIASPQSSKLSKTTNQNISVLKMYQVFSIAPTNQEAITSISDLSLKSFPSAGTLVNGKLFQADTLQAPSIESDYCWLPAPTAMSTKFSRPPGLSKLENFLKKNELINKGEVLNPAILCQWFGIPANWLNPSESLTAIQILENSVAQQEIFSILESHQLHSEELSISNLAPDNSIPENFLEEKDKSKKQSQSKKRRNKKGSLYKYLENKRLKDGRVVSYPCITSDFRDPKNPYHWRWGYHWDEKIDGIWKGRSIGSIPPGIIAYIQNMRDRNVQLPEIISFIKKAKRKK